MQQQQGVGITMNSLIKGRWTVIRKIGQGAFGEIYSGKNIINNEMVAIKVEKIDTKKQVLKLEVAVLKKLQACPYVCRFITCGRHNDYNYMVMELLGDNLSELRRRQGDGKFSMTTTLKLGIQMIQSLQAVHDLGYLHRDVKPSNFTIGLGSNKRHITYLIDFGLARRYVLSSGEVRQARDQTGFRGTARYASINSHLSKDLGRRDDLWSILYVLIEFALGQLPWRKLKDKDQIGDMKIKYNTQELVKDLPRQFELFMRHLKTLSYEERPNYAHLLSLLTECYHEHGGTDATLFDWEVAAQNNSSNFINSSHSQLPRVTVPSPSTVDVEASRDNESKLNRDSPIENELSPPAIHRKDSASASVIAASSDNGEKSGSWNQKSINKRPEELLPTATDDTMANNSKTKAQSPTTPQTQQLQHQPSNSKLAYANNHPKTKGRCCTIM